MGASSNSPLAPRHERFGNFILLAETERSWLATEHRAAHLGDKGFDRLVHLVRFAPGSTPAAPGALIEHVRAAVRAGAGVLRPLGTGKAGAGWLSYEYAGGRSLRAVLERARDEVFPLSLDNALEIARQVCLTLEKVHARPLASGEQQVHGFLAPWSVIVSYDGAVRLRGFGLWAARALGGLPAEESGTLAPEQSEGRADARTDVYGLGALVLESLRLTHLPGGQDPRALIGETMGPEGDPLPPALTAALERALSPRPEDRQAGPFAFRQELEALLFAGDVAPTTFNLAFFMETLFRGTVEADARAIEEETHEDYSAYLPGAAGTESPAKPVAAAPPAAAPPEPRAVSESAPVSTSVAVPEPDPVPALDPVPEPAAVPAPPPPPAPVVHERPAPAPFVERAAPAPPAARATGTPARSPLPIVAAVVAVVLIAGGAFYFLKMRGPAAVVAPVPTTLSPEAQAAVARVQELEARLKTLEDERVQAEAAAAAAATQRVQAEAKAKGQKVDPRALERALEDAARKVRQAEEKRQQEERQRLEEQKRAEEARLAAASVPTTLPAPAEPPPTVASVAPTDPPPAQVAEAAAPASEAPAAPSVYDFGAPGVVPPALVSQEPLEYPLVARNSRITGSVTVSAIVNEQGRVERSRATSGNPVLRKAAVDHIAGRRYRPALKDGVPVKMQMVFLVNFKG